MMQSHQNSNRGFTHRKVGDLCISVRPEIEKIVPYTPGEGLEDFCQRTGIPPESVVKLNSNESPYSAVPAVRQALYNYDRYNQYPDTHARRLKTTLSSYTGVQEDAIVIGHGSMEIITLLWNLFLSPGDALLCCPPTFSLYTSTTTLCGARMSYVGRGSDYEIDREAILQALTPERVR